MGAIPRDKLHAFPGSPSQTAPGDRLSSFQAFLAGRACMGRRPHKKFKKKSDLVLLWYSFRNAAEDMLPVTDKQHEEPGLQWTLTVGMCVYELCMRNCSPWHTACSALPHNALHSSSLWEACPQTPLAYVCLHTHHCRCPNPTLKYLPPPLTINTWFPLVYMNTAQSLSFVNSSRV